MAKRPGVTNHFSVVPAFTSARSSICLGRCPFTDRAGPRCTERQSKRLMGPSRKTGRAFFMCWARRRYSRKWKRRPLRWTSTIAPVRGGSARDSFGWGTNRTGQCLRVQL